MKKVLITGIAGPQGRLLTRCLIGEFEVCGVDRVPWDAHPRDVTVHTVDLRKKQFEEVIRHEQPNAIAMKTFGYSIFYLSLLFAFLLVDHYARVFIRVWFL